MASSSWHRLGDGFASDDIPSLKHSVIGKSNQKLHGKQLPKKQWNKAELLSSFSIPAVEKDSDSEQIDNISWSASSSEEEDDGVRDKDKSQSKFSGKRKNRLSKGKSKGVKKRIAVADDSLLPHKTKNFKCSTSKFEFDKKAPQTIGREVKSDSSILAPYGISSEIKEEKKTENKWSFSTFEEMKMSDTSKLVRIPRKSQRKDLVSCDEGSESVSIVGYESSSESEDLNEQVEEESDAEEMTTNVLGSPHHTTQTNAVLEIPFVSPDTTQIDQVEISSVISSGTSGPASQKVRASDWAVSFQKEVSPQSNEGEEKDCPLLKQLDSGKKKQKYSRNSLVGQLSRLINREKSSARFWQHSSSKESLNKDNSRSVKLHVLSKQRQFSLCIAQCRVVDDKDSLLNCSTCQVIFARNIVDKVNIQNGSILQLFPPWKQLDEGKKSTILCGNQARVINNSDNAVISDQVVVDSSKEFVETDINPASHSCKEEKMMSFEWACPCKQNSYIPSNQCPAYQTDHYVKYFSQMTLSQNPTPCDHPVHFHSVQSAGLFSSHNSLPSPVQCGLIQSIQEERAGMDCMPPFAATVLRVFRQKVLARNSVCLSLLLEDSSGTLALVQQDEIDLSCYRPSWSTFAQMEGKACVCSNLTMVTRRTKDRDSSLFQVIQHVWKNQRPEDEIRDDSPLSQMTRKIPSFCYILQPLGESSSWLQLSETTESQRKEGLELETLTNAVKVSCHQRFSCVVKLIRVQHSQESSDKSGLFVCDPCDGEMDSTVFYPLSVDRKCVGLEKHKDRKPRICLLQDVIWNGNAVKADEYSTLLPQSDWFELGVNKFIDRSLLDTITRHSIRVPSLSLSKTTDLFVTVSGHIVNVIADKCYLWEGCGECGMEMTAVDSSGVPMCPACNNKASHNTQMNMEVEILEDLCKDCITKIDLTQSTISSLLPREVPNEGFDTDRVLGKPITALAYVLDRSNDAIRLYEVDISDN